MKDLSDRLLERVQRGVTSICTCISVRRRDAVGYGFTDHDEPIEYGGQTYLPYNSFSRTSIATGVSLEVDVMEMRGILNSTAVARADIASGKFDFAEVEVFLIDYEEPDAGRCLLRVGWMGEVVMNEDGTFAAEVRGLSHAYTTRIGEVYQPECRADLGDARCKVPLSPDVWQPTTLYRVGDAVLGHINAAENYANLALVNPSFDEDDFDTPTRNPVGWVGYGPADARWNFTSSIVNGISGPKSGERFMFGTEVAASRTTEIGCYQIIVLEDNGVDLEAIDTGLSRLMASIWMASMNGKGKSQFRIYALPESVPGPDSLQPIYDSGLKQGYEDVWFLDEGCKDVIIPAGTRRLKFDLHAYKSKSANFGAAFDLLKSAINYPEGTWGSQSEYGDVCFVAQNNGETGEEEPAFSSLLDDTVLDGTVTWKTVPAWVAIDTVMAPAASNIAFAPTLIDQVDGYYDGGLLTWETGRNAGRTQEVKTQVDGKITLFQRPFYPMQPGDRYVIRPGCDKRMVTCSTKFSNIVNFRGEPHVPGQDEYFYMPNATTGA